MLWERTVEDLQVNTPFRRLRASWLLFLQLLALLAILFAVADPVLETPADVARRLVLIIDRSASMQAIDGDLGADDPRLDDPEAPPPTRLDEAKARALEQIEQVGRRGGPEEAMVLTFGRDATVVAGFQTDRRLLRDAVLRIEASDERGDIAAALELADAYAATASEEEAIEAPDIAVISDRAIDPANAGAVRANRLERIAVGDPTSLNVGVVALDIRRDVDDPTTAVLFARLVSTDDEARSTLLQITAASLTPDADGGNEIMHEARLPVELPAATETAPGEATITHRFPCPGGALVRATAATPDVLRVDNAATAVLPGPEGLRIAYVQPGDGGDPFLLRLIEMTEPAALRVISQPRYEAMTLESGAAARDYDFLIFDRVSPARLPDLPSLTVGAAPASVETIAPSSEGARTVFRWAREHPLLRYVALDNLRWRDFGAFELGPSAEALVVGPDGPVVITVGARGIRHVVVGFELVRSNWPQDVSFAIFLQNVLDIVGGAGRGLVATTREPGLPVSVRMQPGVTRGVIRGPFEDGGGEMTVRVPPGRVRAITPALPRVGVYRIEGAASPDDVIAVSLLSDAESSGAAIASESDVFSAGGAAAGGLTDRQAPRPLWPWALGVALGLLVLEWLLYCARARS